LEFFEARNALRIAESEGAERYAADSYRHAVKLMDEVDADATQKHMARKQLIAVSREEVQVAEDAREIAVKKMDEERLSDERQASADSLSRSRAQTDDATRQKEYAQSDQARAEIGRRQAESDAARSRADAADAQSIAVQARADNANTQSAMIQARAEAADAQSASVQARTDADNAQSASIQARNDATDAQSATARARSDMADNQASSATALAAAQADADRSRLTAQQAQLSAQQADADKAAMRTKLSEQLNSILQTRDTARGLIVSMSDVLFDSGKYSLKPGAREKLAKVAGILLAYPGLNIEVGGYTDNVGGDAMNQTLSENRAGSVRDYLVREGVSTNSVSSRGFGNSLPVASNDNSAGRQQNRRVELLVSGEAIGNPVNATTGSLR
jgi:outer membrane protein OmpA-like peptidoglycan-associated protein